MSRTNALFRGAVLGSLIVACCASLAQADAGRGRHKKIYVVPTPGKVTVDAKLDDWDLSGQILMYVYRETVDMQSAKVAMMYDKDAFYICGIVRDPSPMMNRHDPKVDADKAWDADVCQLFFSLDPDLPYPVQMGTFSDNKGLDKDLATLYLWHFTDRQEASMAELKGLPGKAPADYQPLGAVPPAKFQAAYAKADDGRGYTFEYRIPWATLGAKRPLKAGDIAAGSVMVFWSTPDGLKTAGGAAWAYDVMSFAGFPFQNAGCWGKFIFAEKGGLPRDLVEEGLPPEPPLPLKFTYDVPEDSEVTVQLFDEKGTVERLLVAQGARRAGSNVELWNGLDDLGKPIPAGTYKWKGLYHQPIKTKFCFSAHNSGQPPYKTDDNTGGWGADHGTPTCVYAAGDYMLLGWNMSESGWGIIRTDLKGKKQWGIKHNAEDMATDGERIFVAGDNGYEGAESVKVFDLKDGRPLNWGNGHAVLAAPAGGDSTQNVAVAVACAGGRVYVSWGARNLIGIYDAKTGDLQETWTVPAPRRLVVRPDGALLAISEGKVVVVRKDGVKPFATERIDEPSGVAVAADGTTYVANAGKLQSVSVFGADGKYLRTIGKEGGRPAVGRYDPSGIYMPGGVALAKDGKLWVAETTDGPKRHSVWDAQSGVLSAEFFGASSYFGWAWIDPKRPDEIYCHNVLWKIDWAKNTCTPFSTIWRATEPNMLNAPNPGGYGGHFRVTTARNGKQFGVGMSDYSGMLYMRDGDVFKPVAGTIRVASGPYGGGLLYPAMEAFHKQHNAGAYLWQDANNDQKVQENELTVSPAGRGEMAFNWIDSDLNVWCDAGWIYKPVRFEPDGRPVYDFSQKTDIPFKGQNANCGSLWLDPADEGGDVYTLAAGTDPGFARWTRDGKQVWGFRGIIPWNMALSLEMGMPGKLYGLTMPLGVAGDFTGAACYAAPYYLFTRDGLYVSMIMRNGRDGKLGADITASETLTGQLVKPEGMNRYFLLAGDQDGRVTEILGLDTVKRLPGGSVTLSEADVKTVGDAMRIYETKKAKLQKLAIVRGKPALETAGSVGKTVDGERSFVARTAYDAANLYVQFEVTGSDLINAASDPQLIFKGGNLLDIQLAADPKADAARKTPAPGDVRILVTRQAGKPVAVIYRPKVAGFKGEPIVMTSPTGKEPFDKIETAAEVALEYKKTGGGFEATVTIPLALIGWTPQPGATVRFDVGYVFGNATGTQAALRAYWSNNGFSANVVNDVPNESRLEPAEWGTATVE